VADYLTTKEVAKYLKLNDKKVYSLVASGQLPGARISGKWLFPKHMIDQWVEKKAAYPLHGLMRAVLSDMLIIQGSDDWLFSRAAAKFQAENEVPVASATVGSLAGLSAIGADRAHLAGFHVENSQVRQQMGNRKGCYLFNLLQRSQGIIFDRKKNPDISGMDVIAERGHSFAVRQALSGTYHLVERLCRAKGIEPGQLNRVGPYSTHLELALAIRKGEAKAGVGIQVAADMCGLDFIPLASEPFKLAVPVSFASHPQVSHFLDFIIGELKDIASKGMPGYGFTDLGRMEVIGSTANKEN